MGHTTWEFVNLENTIKNIDEDKSHDACYMPMNINIAGAIDIHDVDSG
ncbi:MAG: hypothetical protein HRT69_15120 [Flavobacteriaceae bacterium]|nr:hypothetical protein [Flavobacteriaceae bacterium]